jgi:hypothetical protein
MRGSSGALSSKFLASPFNEQLFLLYFRCQAMLIALLAGERVAY